MTDPLNLNANGAEPAQRRTNDDGSKFYEHPSRTEDVPQPGGSVLVRPARYVSVTTALGVVNKPSLVFWSANLAAQRAMGNLPKLIGAARREGCGRARARTEPLGCGECAECVEFWVAIFHHGEKERRAREGSAAHDVLEWWILSGEWRYVPRPDWGEYAPTPDEMAPYLASLQAFIADYGLTPESFLVAECTVFHHVLRYAGTLDAIVEFRPVTKKAAELCARINHQYAGTAGSSTPPDAPVRLVVDLKSREGDGAAVYVEYTLQLGAYRFAETMLPKRASADMETAMFATDGAAVLQVRPDGYTLRPVVTDGQTLKAWRAVLDLSHWHSTLGELSTQVQAFPKPDGWKAPTWERATDPTGILCGCPYCDDPNDARCMFAPGPRPVGRHTKTVPAPKPVLSPSAKLGVRERVGSDEAKPPPRKRAPRKAPGAKAAPAGTSATLDSMITGQHVIGAEVGDEHIPF